MRRCGTLCRDLENNLLQRTNGAFKAVTYACGGITLIHAYIKLSRKVIVQKIILSCKWCVPILPVFVGIIS